MATMSGTWRPEIVVGIDFGMTCTGVAYSVGPDWARPEVLQRWPGMSGSELKDKVDTVVAYDRRSGKLVSWGCMVDPENRDLQIEERFKLYLDPGYEDGFREVPPLEEAQRWFKDYLGQIYKAVVRHLAETRPTWEQMNIEWLFSVPTTWKNPAMIAETEKMIRQAGFESMKNHKVEVSSTEAEAAAVYASKHSYQKDDVLLICDCGGGTTDVNVLKVTASAVGTTQLTSLSWVEGRAIGSTLIDFNVHRMLVERLKTVRHELPGEPGDIAERMMKTGSRFESFKCSFGSAETDVPTLPLHIKELRPGTDLPQAHIWDSKMILTKDELQRLFDEQIEKIFRLVDEQLERLQTSHAGESVSYLVLSGGLGSSPYVNSRLRAHYQTETSFANAQNMRIMTTPKPQLAVVYGLVQERIQQIRADKAVYVKRCCRNSYGIVVREPYDQILHQGEVVVQDPRDRRMWAENQIAWFIEQGRSISVREGVKRHYKLKLDPGSETRPFKMRIVMSSLPASQLPRSLKQAGGSKSVCAVESVLSKDDMKLKNRHWYNRGPRYHRAEFDVQVLIGAATLRFQIIGKDGISISKAHEEIQVQWAVTNEQVAMHAAAKETSGLYKG